MLVRRTKAHSRRVAEQPKTLAQHLAELQARLLVVGLAFLAVSSAAYYFHEQIVRVVLAPLNHEKLVYLTPGGGFSFIFQTILWVGFLAVTPLLVMQIYQFLKPILAPQFRKYSVRMVLASGMLMFGGAVFGYFVAIPSALRFLTTFAGDFVIPNLTADSYLSFVAAYMLGLGLLFQLPLLLILWNWITPLPPGKLLTSQQYVIVTVFILAAIITPTPDPINQLMVALPVIGVYQIGVVSVFVMNRKRPRQAPQPIPRAIQTELTAPAEPKLPSKPLAAQPVAPSRQLTLTRSIDGFSSPQGRHIRKVSHQVIQAPFAAKTVVRVNTTRHRTSIDGILSANSA